MRIIHGRVFDGRHFADSLVLRVTDGTVAEAGEALPPLPGERTLDLEGDYLLPGFVDVHIHAVRGYDAMAGEDAVRGMSRALAELGVAAFCPTTMSASPESTRRALAGIRAVMDNPEPKGAAVLGAHMEAPFLSPFKAGAQRKEFFRLPDWSALEFWTDGRPDTVRLVTVAPELPGSEAFIRKAREVGIRVSIGHTEADAETVRLAAGWGADHITHLFNAQTPLHHRRPGVPGAALADGRFFCELICDGIHLHPDVVRLACLAKGAERALAITDAMEAAGMPDGVYQLGGQEVAVRNGAARLADGTLAGSVLTMPQALRNLICFGVPPEDACAMCSSTPAASVGETACGRPVPGSPAVFTRWTPDWTLRETLAFPE